MWIEKKETYFVAQLYDFVVFLTALFSTLTDILFAKFSAILSTNEPENLDFKASIYSLCPTNEIPH